MAKVLDLVVNYKCMDFKSDMLSAKLLQSCPTGVTLWTVAHHAPLSMGFSRQKYWSGLPCSPPGDLPDPGFEPASLMSNLHWQEMATHSVPLPGKSHGQRSLVGYNPWDCKELDMTEQLHFTTSTIIWYCLHAESLQNDTNELIYKTETNSQT